MRRNAKRASLLALALTIITIFTACDLTYRNSADASLSFAKDDSLEIARIRVELSTGSNSVAYRSYEASWGYSLALGSLFYGSYSISALGFSHSGDLVATGRGDLSVEAGGANSTTVTFAPVATPDTTGHLSTRVEWNEGTTSFPVTRVDLVCEGETLLSFPVTDGSNSVDIDCTLSGMENASCSFRLYSGTLAIGESASFRLSIYSQQTTVLETVDVEVEEMVAVSDLVLSWAGDAMECITYSFALPDEDFESLILHYSDSIAVYRREFNAEALEAMKGEDGRYSGTIPNTQAGRDYTVSLSLRFANGSTSPSVSAEITMPIPLDSVTISGLPGGLQPGDSGRLTAVYNPANATDWGGTWNSSNPDVVTIDQDGNYTVQYFGQTTISYRAENRGRTTQARISVNLEAPVLAARASESAITLEWTASEWTQSFELYRSVDGIEENEPIVLDGDVRSYSDSRLTAGRSYSYRLVALAGNGTVSAESGQSDTFSVAQNSITLVIEGPRESITISLESDDPEGLITNGALITLFVTPLDGIVSYQWLINGEEASDQLEIEGNIQFSVPLESEAYISMHRFQELTLVLIDGNGQKYSAGFDITYRPVE